MFAPRTSADLSNSNQRRSRNPVSSTPRRRATDRHRPVTGSARAPAQPGRADHEQPSRAQRWQERDALPPRVEAAAACGQRHPATGEPPRRATPRDARYPSRCSEAWSSARNASVAPRLQRCDTFSTARPPPTRSRVHARIGVRPAGTNVQPAGSVQPARHPPQMRAIRDPTTPSEPLYLDAKWTRSGRASPSSARTPERKTLELQAKPSVGLEPTTPSLPWKGQGLRAFTDALGWALNPCKQPQYGVYGCGGRNAAGFRPRHQAARDPQHDVPPPLPPVGERPPRASRERRRGVGASKRGDRMSDRSLWLEEWCPTCRVAPGARCRAVDKS